MPKHRVALLAGALACAFWGGLYPAIKVVMEVLPPFVLLVVRLALAALLLWPFVARRGGFPREGRLWLRALAVGAVGFGVALGFQFVGTHLSTAYNGVLITTSTPTFVVLFGAWLLRERLTPRQIVALVVATVGVLVVIDPRQARLDAMFWGNLALLAGALGWALYSVLVRWLTREMDTLQVSLMTMLGGLPVVFPLAAWQWPHARLEAFTWETAAGVLYVVIFATAAAMFLWNYAFTYLESGTAALTFFVQPVVGVLVGALWLGERMTVGFFIGGVLIAIGMYLSATHQGSVQDESL